MLSFNYSGVVQLVARQPLELVILVRVQAPEPILLDLANKLKPPAAQDIRIWQQCEAGCQRRSRRIEDFSARRARVGTSGRV